MFKQGILIFVVVSSLMALEIAGVTKEFQERSVYYPLEKCTVILSLPSPATMKVFDGKNREYFSETVQEKVVFPIYGALGYHRIELFSPENKKVDTEFIRVTAQTRVVSDIDWINQLFQRLQWQAPRTHKFKIKNEKYILHSGWIRDNYYNFTGDRYHTKLVKHNPDIFFGAQRENGMIYDKISGNMGRPNKPWHTVFENPFDGDTVIQHIRKDLWGEKFTSSDEEAKEYGFSFERIPVEADVEYLAVLYLFEAWQASGETAWMQSLLPKAEQALEYSMNDPLRWDNKHGLMKRGFTIDTWDFQHPGIQKYYSNKNNLNEFDHMYVDEKTPMALFHGDNSGLIAASRALAAMYHYVGDKEKAENWAETADRTQKNMTRYLWNGSYFKHLVPLDKKVVVEDGVDVENMMSLTLPHAITRGAATEDQALAILDEYKKRKDSRKNLPGEWFTLDPPFRSFGSFKAGKYVNGTVSLLTGGELAAAACMYGRSEYGADILERINKLYEYYNRFAGIYPIDTCKTCDWKKETFYTVDVSGYVTSSYETGKKNSWFTQGNDLKNFPTGDIYLLNKPFRISTDGLIVLSHNSAEFPSTALIETKNKEAQTIYIAHAATVAPRDAKTGAYTIIYTDNSRYTVELIGRKNIGGWWQGRDEDNWLVAWRGKNDITSTLTIGVSGFENPFPNKKIKEIECMSTEGTLLVLGVTLSDQNVQLRAKPLWVHNIPSEFATGAIKRGLYNGLCGVSDLTCTFDSVKISPKFSSIQSRVSSTTLRYPASLGYISYRWIQEEPLKQTVIHFSGSGNTKLFEILQPAQKHVKTVSLNGKTVPYSTRSVGKERFVTFSTGVLGGTVVVQYN